MLDVQFGVIVDVETSPGNRSDEVGCTQLMLDRIESNYDMKPKRLMGDSIDPWQSFNKEYLPSASNQTY